MKRQTKGKEDNSLYSARVCPDTTQSEKAHKRWKSLASADRIKVQLRVTIHLREACASGQKKKIEDLARKNHHAHHDESNMH